VGTNLSDLAAMIFEGGLKEEMGCDPSIGKFL
jgi:hypothetical protein